MKGLIIKDITKQPKNKKQQQQQQHNSSLQYNLIQTQHHRLIHHSSPPHVFQQTHCPVYWHFTPTTYTFGCTYAPAHSLLHSTSVVHTQDPYVDFPFSYTFLPPLDFPDNSHNEPSHRPSGLGSSSAPLRLIHSPPIAYNTPSPRDPFRASASRSSDNSFAPSPDAADNPAAAAHIAPAAAAEASAAPAAGPTPPSSAADSAARWVASD